MSSWIRQIETRSMHQETRENEFSPTAQHRRAYKTREEWLQIHYSPVLWELRNEAVSVLFEETEICHCGSRERWSD